MNTDNESALALAFSDLWNACQGQNPGVVDCAVDMVRAAVALLHGGQTFAEIRQEAGAIFCAWQEATVEGRPSVEDCSVIVVDVVADPPLEVGDPITFRIESRE